MNRRTFIGTSIAASLAAATKPSWAADTAHYRDPGPAGVAHSIDRIGLQLYTVREAMKTDFEGTIAKVAATGYKEVEFAGVFDPKGGYFGRSPKEVARGSRSCSNRRSQLHHLPVDRRETTRRTRRMEARRRTFQ